VAVARLPSGLRAAYSPCVGLRDLAMGVRAAGGVRGVRGGSAREWCRRSVAAHRVVACVAASAALYACALMVASTPARCRVARWGDDRDAGLRELRRHRDRALAAVASGGGDHCGRGRVNGCGNAYGGQRPDLARALEFYDRWLPGTMRRMAAITGQCMPHCVTLRGPGDWAAGPRYR
jgi:hypothetical protein